MKKIIIVCAFSLMIVGCASTRKCIENHPTKKSYQPDMLLDNKENHFTKQFQEADSMFNEKYGLK